jgi:anti-sigma-K factor RskA
MKRDDTERERLARLEQQMEMVPSAAEFSELKSRVASLAEGRRFWRSAVVGPIVSALVVAFLIWYFGVGV